MYLTTAIGASPEKTNENSSTFILSELQKFHVCKIEKKSIWNICSHYIFTRFRVK